MIPVVEFLVAMLPLDSPGRRAVDETLADWRHEAGEAQTVAGRAAAAVRGIVAVAVAVAFVTVRDATSVQTLRIVGIVTGSACLMAIGFRYRLFERYAAQLMERGLGDANLIGLWASMLPQAVVVCIPLALLAPPFVRRVTTRSLMGPCLVLMVVSAVNLGWITPVANQWFRQTTGDMLRQSALLTATEPERPGGRGHGREGRPYDDLARAAGLHIPRGIAEYTVVDLVRESRAAGTRTREAVASLNGRAAGLLMVPVCLILGVQARRIGAARRWKVGAGLLAWVTFTAGYTTAIAAVVAAFGLLRGGHLIELSEVLRQYSVWVVPIVSASMAFALARIAHRVESHRDDTQPISL